MDLKLRKKLFWNEVSRGGLIAGAFFAMTSVVTSIYFGTDSSIAAVANNIFQLIGGVVAPFMLGIRFAKMNGAFGLTYTRALGFMSALLMFAGLIYGAVTYFTLTLNNELATSVVEQTAKLYKDFGVASTFDPDTMSNPVLIIFSGMVTVFITSFFPVLVIAALIRRYVPQQNNS